MAEDRLALQAVDRPDLARADAAALAAAHWAFRRLEAAPGPDGAAVPGWDDPPEGRAWLRWQARQGALAGAQPLVRAAAGFLLWRAEAWGRRCWSQRCWRRGSAAARGALPFLPLARAAAPSAAGGGSADRLCAWAAAAKSSWMRALMEFDRLSAWEARARAATAGMSGRTPGRSIDALLASPALSAGMAVRATGAPVPRIRRNIARLEDATFVHEFTGQGRYRGRQWSGPAPRMPAVNVAIERFVNPAARYAGAPDARAFLGSGPVSSLDTRTRVPLKPWVDARTIILPEGE